jgi:tRNA(adenine34) deaminase
MNDHDIFMKEAILLAKEAANDGEVPVGCVIVRDGKIIGRGRNRREVNKNALAHAEIEAINEACATLGGWRLPECTLYVTLEPCPMCAGAIVNSRIENAVIALPDAKSGALGSVINFNTYPLNHKVHLTYGVLEDESREIMQEFFAKLRNKRLKMQF